MPLLLLESGIAPPKQRVRPGGVRARSGPAVVRNRLRRGRASPLPSTAHLRAGHVFFPSQPPLTIGSSLRFSFFMRLCTSSRPTYMVSAMLLVLDNYPCAAVPFSFHGLCWRHGSCSSCLILLLSLPCCHGERSHMLMSLSCPPLALLSKPVSPP